MNDKILINGTEFSKEEVENQGKARIKKISRRLKFWGIASALLGILDIIIIVSYSKLELDKYAKIVYFIAASLFIVAGIILFIISFKRKDAISVGRSLIAKKMGLTNDISLPEDFDAQDENKNEEGSEISSEDFASLFADEEDGDKNCKIDEYCDYEYDPEGNNPGLKITAIKSNKTLSLDSNKEKEVKNDDKFEEIKKYKDLYDNGIITKEEFEKKKKELLNL